MPIWLGFAWTSPNTLLGLFAGLLTFQKPRVSHGLLLFDRAPRGLTALMLRMNRAAMTIGFVVVSARPVEGTLLAHERHHVKQYCAWGPLMIPVYAERRSRTPASCRSKSCGFVAIRRASSSRTSPSFTSRIRPWSNVCIP
jgi:hypothetical protein